MSPDEPSDREMELLHELTAVKEQLRITTYERDSAFAQISELQSTPATVHPQKSRWFGYTSPTRKGAFDMMEVCAWEGSQLRPPDGPWNYTLRFRFSTITVVLDQAAFSRFADAFDAYLNTTV